MSYPRVPPHPPCYQSPLYSGGYNQTEQIIDSLLCCHHCHRSPCRGRNRMLVACGHTVCEECFSDLLQHYNSLPEPKPDYMAADWNKEYKRKKEMMELSDNESFNRKTVAKKIEETEDKLCVVCPQCHTKQFVKTRLLDRLPTNIASETIVDRLLRRHNAAMGCEDAMYNVREFYTHPKTGKASF